MSRNVVNPGIDRDSWRSCSVKLTREGLPAGTTWEPLDCHRPSPGDRAIGMWKGKMKQSETKWSKLKHAETMDIHVVYMTLYTRTRTSLYILYFCDLIELWHLIDLLIGRGLVQPEVVRARDVRGSAHSLAWESWDMVLPCVAFVICCSQIVVRCCKCRRISCWALNQQVLGIDGIDGIDLVLRACSSSIWRPRSRWFHLQCP